MRRKLSASFLCLAVYLSAANALDEDYLICKPVQNLFSLVEHQNNSINQRGLQGPPGKRGPRGVVGVRGSPGPRGPMPNIDWNAIDQHIKVQLDARLSCSGVVYGRYCYKLIIKAMNTNGGGGKSWAASQCAYRGGGELVDIENEEMYNLLYTYIQDSWVAYTDHPSYSFANVWLGSRYENGALRNSSGSEVFAKWYPGFPDRNLSDVVWEVGTKASKGTRIGMRTPSSSSYARPVPLCRFLIN